MTHDLRIFLLGALGLPSVLMACGPTVGTVVVPEPPTPLVPDYGECDATVIDTLDVLADGITPETGQYLRCATDMDRDACMDDCGDQCVQDLANLSAIPTPPGFEIWADCGPMWLDDGCCVAIWVDDFCCEGRPFLVGGVARVASPIHRDDWLAPVHPAPIPAHLSAAVAQHWLNAAQQEHASIAAFSRFSLVLLHLGAPADLLIETQQASLDEVRHARACFALASAYGAEPVGPGPLAIDAALDGELDPHQAFVTLFKEGCIGETLASLTARAGAAEAIDPVVANLLNTIAGEEAQHAALAWKTVRWMLGEFPALQPVFAQLLVEATAPSPADSDLDLRAHGIVDGASKRQLLANAITKIVQPIGAEIMANLAHPVEALVVGDPARPQEGPRRSGAPGAFTI